MSEAAAQGITIETETGALWFRHPLLAETIAATMKSWERAELHSELAASWQAAVEVDERDRATSLALHYVAAGDIDQGFAWSLRAADEAEAVRGRDEEASHLSTAASLMDHLSDETAAHDRPCRSADAGGACLQGRGRGPQRSAALRGCAGAGGRAPRTTRSWRPGSCSSCRCCARGQPTTPRPCRCRSHEKCSRLPKRVPDSPERAQAFGQLAFAEVFNGNRTARGHAETAVRLAESVGTSAALVWAHGARAHTFWGTDEGIADAERAFALAAVSDDPQLVRWSGLFLSNSVRIGRPICRRGRHHRQRVPHPCVTRASSTTPQRWARWRHAGTSCWVAGLRPGDWFASC